MLAQSEATRGARARQWALCSLLGLGLCVGVRMLDVSAWRAPALNLDDERLMARYDSYAWLAGAEGVNQFDHHPFAYALRAIRAATGAHLAAIGFWVPAFVAPLIVVPVCLLAVRWGVPWSGVLSGVAAGGAFLYLQRTRLGHLDSDVFALLLPVCLGAGLVLWLEPDLRRPWGSASLRAPSSMVLGAVFLGLLLQGYRQLYEPGLTVALAMWGVGVLVCLAFGEPDRRLPMVACLVLTLVLGTSVMVGLLFAGVALSLVWMRPAMICQRRSLILGLVVLAAWLGYQGYVGGVHSEIASQVSRYAARAVEGQSSTAPILPDTITTVQEARRITFPVMVHHLAGHWVLFVAGLGGLVYLWWRRPSGVVFVPMLLLGLASMTLGYRFAMYGGVVIALGLGVGWALVLRDLRAPTLVELSFQIVVLVAVLGLTVDEVRRHKPGSFLSKPYAEALRSLRGTAAPDAQLWLWWDYGYAAQYFARRMTFADGSRNTGEYLIPLAAVFAARSPAEACRIVAFTAREQSSGRLGDLDAATDHFAGNPFFTLIHGRTPEEAHKALEDVRRLPTRKADGLAEQYLIVSWENIWIAPVLYTLGTWDVVAGSGAQGENVALLGEVRFDLERGIVTLASGRHYMRSLDVMSGGSTKHFDWPSNVSGMRVVRSTSAKAVAAMDESLYSSLVVQMLVADPQQFRPYFDLVVDRAPSVRIYRLDPHAGAFEACEPASSTFSRGTSQTGQEAF